MSRAKLIEQFGNNVLADTLIWNPDFPEWKEASQTEFASHFSKRAPKMPAPPVPSKTANVLWNYVGSENQNVGPIKESDLLQLNLPGDTYVWNGTSVTEWTFLRDTYLASQ